MRLARTLITAAIVGSSFTAASALAGTRTLTLDFEGIAGSQNVVIDNFYAPDAVFSGGAAASKSSAAGGLGSFQTRFLGDPATAPTIDLGTGAMFFRSTFTVELADGFNDSFSFYYSLQDSESLLVEALDATGQVLGSFSGQPGGNATFCPPNLQEDNNFFCVWSQGTIDIGSMASTLRVSGSAGGSYLDQFVFTTTTDVGPPGGLPEPGSLALVAGALGALGWARRRRVA
jgi:hypothetical protein